MVPVTHPFGFGQGRLFSQSARKGWGTRLLNSCLCLGRRYWLRSTPEYGENSLTAYGAVESVGVLRLRMDFTSVKFMLRSG
jgi:hypothetical protein